MEPTETKIIQLMCCPYCKEQFKTTIIYNNKHWTVADRLNDAEQVIASDLPEKCKKSIVALLFNPEQYSTELRIESWNPLKAR